MEPIQVRSPIQLRINSQLQFNSEQIWPIEAIPLFESRSLDFVEEDKPSQMLGQAFKVYNNGFFIHSYSDFGGMYLEKDNSNNNKHKLIIFVGDDGNDTNSEEIIVQQRYSESDSRSITLMDYQGATGLNRLHINKNQILPQGAIYFYNPPNKTGNIIFTGTDFKFTENDNSYDLFTHFKKYDTDIQEIKNNYKLQPVTTSLLGEGGQVEYKSSPDAGTYFIFNNLQDTTFYTFFIVCYLRSPFFQNGSPNVKVIFRLQICKSEKIYMASIESLVDIVNTGPLLIQVSPYVSIPHNHEYTNLTISSTYTQSVPYFYAEFFTDEDKNVHFKILGIDTDFTPITAPYLEQNDEDKKPICYRKI